MNNEIIMAIIISVAIVAAFIAAAKFPKIRHAFLVPEGYTALLYHKGKFVATLAWTQSRSGRRGRVSADLSATSG